MNVGGPENQPLQQVTQGVLVADCDVPSFAISMCRQRKYAICELLSLQDMYLSLDHSGRSKARKGRLSLLIPTHAYPFLLQELST